MAFKLFTLTTLMIGLTRAQRDTSFYQDSLRYHTVSPSYIYAHAVHEDVFRPGSHHQPQQELYFNSHPYLPNNKAGVPINGLNAALQEQKNFPVIYHPPLSPQGHEASWNYYVIPLGDSHTPSPNTYSTNAIWRYDIPAPCSTSLHHEIHQDLGQGTTGSTTSVHDLRNGDNHSRNKVHDASAKTKLSGDTPFGYVPSVATINVPSGYKLH